MDMISIFGFQDEFFIIIDNLNPMRNGAFHFAPGSRRFSTRAYYALLRGRYYCNVIFSGCNCPCGCWWWQWYSTTVRVCIIRATFSFILSSFFHRRKTHSYLFSSCSNIALRTNIVCLLYTIPSSRHSFTFEIHPIYDVIFKRNRFNWMNLAIYWCGFRFAFGTVFCIVRFLIFECCTDSNTTLELKVFEEGTALVIRTYVISWF